MQEQQHVHVSDKQGSTAKQLCGVSLSQAGRMHARIMLFMLYSSD